MWERLRKVLKSARIFLLRTKVLLVRALRVASWSSMFSCGRNVLLVLLRRIVCLNTHRHLPVRYPMKSFFFFFVCKFSTQGNSRSGVRLFAYMMTAPRCVLTAFRITSLSWIIIPYRVLDFPGAHSMDQGENYICLVFFPPMVPWPTSASLWNPSRLYLPPPPPASHSHHLPPPRNPTARDSEFWGLFIGYKYSTDVIAAWC